MLAYRLTDKTLQLTQCRMPIPKPGDYEVLARTIVSGVCHTDLHVAKEDLGPVNRPLTLGHEGIGVVKEVGRLVARFKVGDYVGVAWLGETCMECALCKDGRQNLCERQRQTGFRRDGTFAEFFLADERFAAKIPAHADMAHMAPMLCAGVTSYRALQRLDAPSGARIVISGAGGGLGHMAVQLAKAAGLTVIALGFFSDADEQHIRRQGAEYVVGVSHESTTSDIVQGVTQWRSDDTPIAGALILAPAPSAVAAAVQYVSPGATIVTVILPKEPLELDLVTFTLKELTLRSSIVGTPQDLQAAVDLLATGKVTTSVQTRPFPAVSEVLNQLSSGSVSGRIVLKATECE